MRIQNPRFVSLVSALLVMSFVGGMGGCAFRARGESLPEVKKALALERSGSSEEAAAVWERMQAEHPDLWLAPYHLALIHDRRSESSEAKPLYEKALALNPRAAEVETNFALFLLDERDLEGALFHARRATEIESGSARYWYHLGQVQQHRRELDDALVSYGRATAADSKHGPAWYSSGTIYFLKSDPVRAAEAYQKAIEADPQMWNAVYNLALIDHQMGRFAEAERLYKRAIELHPDALNAAENMEDVERFLERERVLLAGLRYQEKSSLERGWLFHKNGLLMRAEEAYLGAVREAPADPRAFENLAHVYFLQGRFADSQRAYQQALDRTPQSAALSEGLTAAKQAQAERAESSTWKP